MLLSEDKYREPSFVLLNKESGVEIRQYSSYVIAKTTIDLKQNQSDNNMFRTLAAYIFGKNKKKQTIPMTAPVTTFKDNDSYSMFFYMLDSDNIADLPDPIDQNIVFEKIDLGKCAVISFSWYINDRKIKKYKKQLENFLLDYGYTQVSPFMINQYNPPWTLPFLRRNEILVGIK